MTILLKIVAFILTIYYHIKGFYMVNFKCLETNTKYYLYKEPLLYLGERKFRTSNKIYDYGYFSFDKLGQEIELPYKFIAQLTQE